MIKRILDLVVSLIGLILSPSATAFSGRPDQVRFDGARLFSADTNGDAISAFSNSKVSHHGARFIHERSVYYCGR